MPTPTQAKRNGDRGTLRPSPPRARANRAEQLSLGDLARQQPRTYLIDGLARIPHRLARAFPVGFGAAHLQRGVTASPDVSPGGLAARRSVSHLVS